MDIFLSTRKHNLFTYLLCFTSTENSLCKGTDIPLGKFPSLLGEILLVGIELFVPLHRERYGTWFYQHPQSHTNKLRGTIMRKIILAFVAFLMLSGTHADNKRNYSDNDYQQNDRTRSFGKQQRSTFDDPRNTSRDNTPRESSTRTTVGRPNHSNGGFGNRTSRNDSKSYEPNKTSGDSGYTYNMPNRPFTSTGRNLGSNNPSLGKSHSTTSNVSRGGTFSGHR